MPLPDFSFSVYSARKEGVDGADLLWWYGAQYLGRQLEESLNGKLVPMEAFYRRQSAQSEQYRVRLEAEIPRDQAKIDAALANAELHLARIPEVHRQAAGLAEFLKPFAAFIEGRDPWQMMADDEIAVLQDAMDEARRQFPELCQFQLPIGLDEVRNLCIRRAMTGDARAVAAIPDDLLAFINQGYRLPGRTPHRMFGIGACPQVALWDHLSDHLLLQIAYDDFADMRFGDMGVFQFWISPENAAARRWDKVELTFECS